MFFLVFTDTYCYFLFMIDEEEIEDTAYTNTLNHLEVLSKAEYFDINQVREELKAMEKYEGLDWTGRGSVKAAEISGIILAYQVFLMRHKKQL